MTRLTKRAIDQLEPRSTDYFQWDADLPGFGVRVMRSGIKSYVVQYRHGGRTRRHTFSHVGRMTPDEARKHARELLVAVDKGSDPSAQHAAYRRTPTVRALCDRFLSEHVQHRCKPSTQREYRRSIDLFICPRFGGFKVSDVKRADISQLHHDMAHIPYQANRTLGVLSKLFNLAELWELRPDGSNPCRHVQKYKEEKRERQLGTEEFARLGQVLTDAEATGSEPKQVIAAIRLLLLTGCRLSEIQRLRWEHVRPDYLALPDSKTGPKRVVLGEPAIAVLDRIERSSDNPYVIVGALPGQHWADLQRPWRRVRAKSGLPNLRIHDLRHAYASTGVCRGESLPMIGKLLGHTTVQTTARYAHLASEPVKATADRISGVIADALTAQIPSKKDIRVPEPSGENTPKAQALTP
jgi:integrase